MATEWIEDTFKKAGQMRALVRLGGNPIPMILYCPGVIEEEGQELRICGRQHVDKDDETGNWATTRYHRKHLCHACGHIWKPANVYTVGVWELPEKTS